MKTTSGPGYTTLPLVTWLTVGLCSLVFLAMLIKGVSWEDPSCKDLLVWGGQFSAFVAQGEWWRLLTSSFIHIGYVHFLANMLILFLVGFVLERAIGSLRLGIVYLAAGLSAGIASILINNCVVSVGASGAIFGLIGTLFIYCFRHRNKLKSALDLRDVSLCVLFYMPFSIYEGFTEPIVDNAAHLGGLVVGMAFGFALPFPTDRKFKPVLNKFTLTTAVIAAALVMSTFLVKAKVQVTPFERVCMGVKSDSIGLLLDGITHYNEDEPRLAREALSQAIEIDQHNVVAHFFSGVILFEESKISEAATHIEVVLAAMPETPDVLALQGAIMCAKHKATLGFDYLNEALRIQPDNYLAIYYRAGALAERGDLEEAMQDFTAAIDLSPWNAAPCHGRGVVHYRLGQYEEALRDFDRSIELSPRSVKTFYRRGVTYARMGNLAQAENDLQKALSLEPDNATRRLAKAAIRSVRKRR